MTKTVKSIGTKSYTYDPIKIYAYGEENNDNPEYNVHIGNYTSISQNCKIITYEGHHHHTNGSTFPFYQINSKSNGDVIIGSDVWIGRDVTIMSGVTIGDGAVIAANSHVVKDVEPYSIYGGNPAKFIKYRFDKELIDKFLQLKWWDYPEHIVDLIIPYLQQRATLDTVLNIERILIDTENMTKLEQINRLYKLILGREADAGGMNHYLNSNMSLLQIQYALWDSDEFKAKHEVGLPVDTTALLPEHTKIFVVNLKRRPDRRKIIETRLNNLALTNYEIIDAVDGKELPENLSDIYDEESAIAIHRKLQRSEIGCALSHINIAKQVIEQNLDYAIIFEDDAEPTVRFKEFVKNFSLEPNKFDFLMFGCFSSNEWFNNKVKTKTAPYTIAEKRSIVYLDDVEFNVGDVSIHRPFYPTQVLDFVNATHAYMISNRGARFLLEHNYPVKLEADNVWNYNHDKCQLMFTNPILVHAKWEDSDINAERKQHQNTVQSYSDNFKARVNHPDFGT